MYLSSSQLTSNPSLKSRYRSSRTCVGWNSYNRPMSTEVIFSSLRNLLLLSAGEKNLCILISLERNCRHLMALSQPHRLIYNPVHLTSVLVVIPNQQYIKIIQ